MYCSFSLIIISIVLIYTSESAVTERYITGKVTHDQPNNIDRNAKIEVALRDISLMDVASKLIASTTITDAKTFPVSYKLKYNPSDIKPHNTYAVSVTISGSDGKLLFINDVQSRVELTGSTSTTMNVAVIKVGGSSSGTDNKVCGPVKCPGKPKKCPYGYQKHDGCEICRCNDPCNPPGKPILCGPKQRCFIDKKPDGTFGTRCGAGSSGKGDIGRKGASKIACQLKKATGSCRAALPRFYYNSATKSCEPFIYGGCGGNENKFHTKAECEQTCKA